MNRPEWIARNPATGAEIARLPMTSAEEVASLVDRARSAQATWSNTPLRDRLRILGRFRAILARDVHLLASAVTAEVGKPISESIVEVTTTLDALRWTLRHASGLLADRRIGPGWQRLMLVRPSVVRGKPWGVIAILGTWNYPLLLDVPAIAQALATGNAVAWKPSELSARVATMIRERLAEAGVSEDLVCCLIGGGDLGRTLIQCRVDKGVFTGGTATGREVLATFASRGIPAVAELSGFDAAIVLPDANRLADAAALAWGAFVGAGQTCVGVKRIYVVGDPLPWANDIADRARKLRVGDPSSPLIDLGPMISEQARDRFHATILATKGAGARVLCGGEKIDGPGWFYAPTVLIAEVDRAEIVLEGAFGPVVLIRGVASIDEAVAAANARSHGLAASVWGRDRKGARSVALRLEAGMVAINDAVTPSAHASSPFGGTKASGFGRMRGAFGLREFVQPQTLSERGEGGYRPHLFPYGDRLPRILAIYRAIMHRGS